MEASIRKNKAWRVGFFGFNNASTHALSTLMGYYALYTQNVLLLGVVMASMIMPMRILDGITDPLAGNLLDKLNTKYGRYRPYMVVGNLIGVITVAIIFYFPLNWKAPIILQQIILILLYAIYIIGVTIQGTATRAGLSIITGDPKQRPLSSLFDCLATGLAMGVATILITGNVLSNSKYDPIVWHVTAGILIALSVLFMVLAVIGISTTDKPEFYLSKKKEKIKFSEFFYLIKRNKPIRRLIFAASSDKLAAQLKGLVMIYFFSNIILKSNLNASFVLISGLVGIIIIFVGTKIAMTKGSMKAFVGVSKLEAIFSFVPFILTLIFIPAGTQIYEGITFGLIAILIVYGFYIGLTGISTNLIYPMLGDISDYELLESKKMMPGTISSLFTFTDKLISSFAGVIVTIIMLISGFTNGKDAVVAEDVYINNTFYYSILIAIFIIPALGHLISILAMKNYPLTEEKMNEIAIEVSKLKKELLIDENNLGEEEND